MPSLVTVNGGRIELRHNRCYVLGRAPDSDVVVEDVASSRQHARITVGALPAALVIEDLGSRNGTFVNEERIVGRTPIGEGDAIRIGATGYRVTLRDDADPRLEDTGTVPIEKLSLGQEVGEEIVRVVRSEGGEGSEFAGQLGSFSLVEVLQLLIQTHRSGTLNIALEHGHARVEIRNGNVCQAEYGRRDGFDALVALAQEEDGVFWLVERMTPCERKIDVPSSRLLLDLCHTIDEAGAERLSMLDWEE